MFLKISKRFSSIRYITNKSDRINELRKRYDTFLEEDKKRRERNEFILNRLDTMRSSTAMVPMFHKVMPPVNEYFFKQKRPEHTSYYDTTLGFDVKKVSNPRQTQVAPMSVSNEFAEPMILKEISKKYILIPKLRSSCESPKTYYNPPDEQYTDNDWKSKYNILDELKKAEKEGCSEGISETEKSNLEDKLLINNEKNIKEISINASNKIYTEVPPKNLQNMNNANPKVLTQNNIEKNIDYNLPFENKQDISINDTNSTNLHIAKNSSIDLNKEQSSINDSNSNVELQELKLENHEIEKEFCNEDQTTELNKSQELREHSFASNKISEKELTESNDRNNIPELSNSESVTYRSSSSNNDQQCNERNEVSECRVETIDMKKLEPSEKVVIDSPVLTNSPKQDYEPEVAPNIDENIISSQIDDFETEQKEMFYSNEDTVIQSNDATHEQNEQYINEQYTYYNEAQPEQPYYTEVNEHEESSERYDPNYQQQYESNYEENAIYGNQQYEGNVTYEHHQEFSNEDYQQQLPVNYDYISSENANVLDQNQSVPDNDYEHQTHANVNYSNQENEVNNSCENEQDITLNYAQQPQVKYDQAHTENVDIVNQNHAEKINEDIIYDSSQIKTEEREAEHLPTVLNSQSISDNRDEIQMQLELETVQNIKKQLDGEDNYIENKVITEDQSEIQNPDINIS